MASKFFIKLYHLHERILSRSPQEFEHMITASFLVVLICCLTVALSGYYLFGSLVADQVTLSLKSSTSSSALAMTTLTYLIVVTVFSKFALTLFPLALGFEEIIAPYISTQIMMERVSVAIKIFLIVLALLFALYVPSFSVLCSFVGLICTLSVSVIFPAAVHLKLFGSHLSTAEKILYHLFILFGIVGAVLGTYATIGI